MGAEERGQSVVGGRREPANVVDGGRDIILSSLGPGDVFGETCAVEGVGSSTTAVAAVASDIARIPADVLAAHLRRDPNTMSRLMRLMSQKLRDVESVASGLALCDVEERLRVLGIDKIASTPEQVREVIHADLARYAKIVKETGAKAE